MDPNVRGLKGASAGNPVPAAESEATAFPATAAAAAVMPVPRKFLLSIVYIGFTLVIQLLKLHFYLNPILFPGHFLSILKYFEVHLAAESYFPNFARQLRAS
jgi:hypothetical protein